MPRIDAITTPAKTPIERSTALVSDWFTLGCTTSRAAIAANTGGWPGRSAPASSHAAAVAIADFATWRIGLRWDARKPAVTRIPRA
jgi:hypothetical protein